MRKRKPTKAQRESERLDWIVREKITAAAPRSGGALPPPQMGGGGSIIDRAQRQIDGGGNRWSR